MALIKPTETFGNRDPPENEPNEQFLFLLEFFVYQLTGERLAKLNRMFFVPTQISLKFLDFDDDDIAITPVDAMFEPQSGIADDVEILNSGRSVMFAMPRQSVMQKSLKFVIDLAVKKKMPENIKPDIIVGNGTIDMTDHFAALRKEMLQCWHTNYPPPKIFDDKVEIFFDDGPVGNVEIYVRISGFGQSLVTEIEHPTVKKNESATYVFKSTGKNAEQLAYECRVIDSSTVENFVDENSCQVCQPATHACSPCDLKGAVEKIGRSSSRTMQDDEKNGNGFDIDGKNCIESIFRGKPFSAPWKPEPSMEVDRYRGLPIQSSRGPVEPCGKAVVLKISGLLDVDDPDGTKKRPIVTIAGESDGQNRPNDPEHDVFILRIGKKGLVGAGEKSDIQVEMRTPKGPERRPPIRYETREIQTDDDDGGKGSGKPGKEKKKKKKKKK